MMCLRERPERSRRAAEKRREAYHLSMSHNTFRISRRRPYGCVRFREEPDEEEDEEEKKDEGDTEEGDDDDDKNSGYSV